MKRILLAIPIIIIPAIALAGTPKTKDNEVCFYNTTITSSQLITSRVNESGGVESVEISDQNPSCLNIRASRKNDESNVNWVQNDMIRSGNEWMRANMLGSGTTEYFPEKLNFVVKIDLTVSHQSGIYTCDNIYLGQGHNFGGNNWWLFNNNNQESQTFSCTKDGESNTTYVKYQWGTSLKSEHREANQFKLKFPD